MGYLDVAKATYAHLLPKDATKVVPCSETDVSILEERFSIKLPTAYREFLLWMGQHGGGFWVGHYGFYKELPDINVWARALVLEGNTDPQLPEDAFVFFWDVAQSFYFFRTNEGDDPPVYFYMDPSLENYLRRSTRQDEIRPAYSFLFENSRRAGFALRSPSFSQCLVAEIAEHAHIHQIIESRKTRAK